MLDRAIRTALLAALLACGARAAGADAYGDARAAFRKAQASKDWKERAAGYVAFREQDRAEAVEDVLAAMARESNGAVHLAGIKALAGYRSPPAIAALATAVRKEKGARRAWALLAARDVPGDSAKGALSDALKEALAGADPAAAAQAALALARQQAQDALPALVAMLSHPEDARLRATAARAIRWMAGASSMGVPRPGSGGPPIPPWLAQAKLVGPLAEALATSTGRERADQIDALERLTGQSFGWDLAAWRALAAGTDPGKIERKPSYPAHVFGIPIYGKRVVVIVDHSLCTDNPHPFDPARLRELCKVPGGRDVPWYNARTNGQFVVAHVKRLVSDLPDGSAFDLVLVGKSVKSAMGRLVPANSGSRQSAERILDNLKVENGMDTLGALNAALDAGGAKDDAAWKSGPDEIVYASCSVPWLAEVTDAAVVGATIALKARLRGVPIHSVGVADHPFEMMTLISEQSGGRYVSRAK